MKYSKCYQYTYYKWDHSKLFKLLRYSIVCKVSHFDHCACWPQVTFYLHKKHTNSIYCTQNYCTVYRHKTPRIHLFWMVIHTQNVEAVWTVTLIHLNESHAFLNNLNTKHQSARLSQHAVKKFHSWCKQYALYSQDGVSLKTAITLPEVLYIFSNITVCMKLIEVLWCSIQHYYCNLAIIKLAPFNANIIVTIPTSASLPMHENY